MEDKCSVAFHTSIDRDRALRNIKVGEPAQQAFRMVGKDCWTPQAVCLTGVVTDYRSKAPEAAKALQTCWSPDLQDPWAIYHSGCCRMTNCGGGQDDGGHFQPPARAAEAVYR